MKQIKTRTGIGFLKRCFSQINYFHGGGGGSPQIGCGGKEGTMIVTTILYQKVESLLVSLELILKYFKRARLSEKETDSVGIQSIFPSVEIFCNKLN